MRESVIETVFSQLLDNAARNVSHTYEYTLAGAHTRPLTTVSSRFEVADAFGSTGRGQSQELRYQRRLKTDPL
jgi:hypothetical protein